MGSGVRQNRCATQCKLGRDRPTLFRRMALWLAIFDCYRGTGGLKTSGNDKRLPCNKLLGRDQLDNLQASQLSRLNFPGPEQISQIKKSAYKTSGR